MRRKYIDDGEDEMEEDEKKKKSARRWTRKAIYSTPRGLGDERAEKED